MVNSVLILLPRYCTITHTSSYLNMAGHPGVTSAGRL